MPTINESRLFDVALLQKLSAGQWQGLMDAHGPEQAMP